ncbi:MAG TPA: NPCBM/NEW2 domain-containing protein [Puia sp.]|jgi:alpha-galactosidase
MRLFQRLFAVLFTLLIPAALFAQSARTIFLGDLYLNDFEVGVVASKSNTNYSGGPMKIAGHFFERGVGVRAAVSSIFMDLDGKASRLSAYIGQDDGGIKGSEVRFYVIGDEKVLYESKPMHVGDVAEAIDLDLTHIQKLGLLVVNPVGILTNRTFGDWAEARIVTQADSIRPVYSKNAPYILTPPSSPNPKINGPVIIGATPGNPFLFTVAATGERPMTYSAQNLPAGLTLNGKTGIITGRVSTRGSYNVLLSAQDRRGKASRVLRIRIGDTLCLTPPMGWNGWNSWASGSSQEKVMASAGAMVSKGLLNHGWSYVNVDDTWEGKRGGKFNAIQPNEKFPDFAGMVRDLHAMGFKAGLYSTPWLATYGGYMGESSDREDGQLSDTVKNMRNKRPVHHIGKYHFNANDAAQWADWGIDFLKYDWPVKDVEPTREESEILRRSGRDIVFSLSNNADFEKAADWARLANSWRIGGDIRDTWHSLYYWGFLSDRWGPYAGPGHWNDPDMLVVGLTTMSSPLHPTRLTPDEQYTHISLWSLLAAPLLIGCPVERMDDFTLSLLTNDEVIDIDQDPLGKQARLISSADGKQIWAKPMEDGSVAVGLFNMGNFGNTPQSYFDWGTGRPERVSVDLARLGLRGSYKIRDVWRQKDLGVFDRDFGADVPYHGVLLVRMYRQ